MFSVAAQSVNPIIDSNTPQKQSSMNYKKIAIIAISFTHTFTLILQITDCSNPNKCLDTDEQHCDFGVFS